MKVTALFKCGHAVFYESPGPVDKKGTLYQIAKINGRYKKSDDSWLCWPDCMCERCQLE